MDAIRLLVMDDDAAVAKVMVAMTEAIGGLARVTTRIDGLLKALDDWAPTHIVVDLVMPGVDGVQVMNLLAERGCDARIIICSGLGDMVLEASMRAAAANGLDVVGVLPKPFNLAQLKALLTAPPAPASRAPAQSSGEASPVLTESDLRRALSSGEIFPGYMPIVDCSDGKLRAIEANARWRHQGGLLTPRHFIPLAERLELIDHVTESIAQQALRQLNKFGDSALGLTLKLSASSLSRFRLVASLAQICGRQGVEPGRLTLQLSMSTEMSNNIGTLESLARLRMQGFRISLGNFGGGSCSLLDLVRLPVSELKIDHALSAKITESRDRRAVCKCIVDLGASLGVRVTACGVESEEDLRFFSEIGTDYAMGFFIGPPMDADAIDAWAAQWGNGLNGGWDGLLQRTARVPASRASE